MVEETPIGFLIMWPPRVINMGLRQHRKPPMTCSKITWRRSNWFGARETEPHIARTIWEGYYRKQLARCSIINIRRYTSISSIDDPANLTTFSQHLSHLTVSFMNIFKNPYRKFFPPSTLSNAFEWAALKISHDPRRPAPPLAANKGICIDTTATDTNTSCHAGNYPLEGGHNMLFVSLLWVVSI